MFSVEMAGTWLIYAFPKGYFPLGNSKIHSNPLMATHIHIYTDIQKRTHQTQALNLLGSNIFKV